MKHARDDYNRIQDPSGKIPADEPVFLIRGQDMAGPQALREYAKAASALGASTKLVTLVLDHAKRMEEWQRVFARKVPDLLGGKP